MYINNACVNESSPAASYNKLTLKCTVYRL